MSKFGASITRFWTVKTIGYVNTFIKQWNHLIVLVTVSYYGDQLYDLNKGLTYPDHTHHGHKGHLRVHWLISRIMIFMHSHEYVIRSADLQCSSMIIMVNFNLLMKVTLRLFLRKSIQIFHTYYIQTDNKNSTIIITQTFLTLTMCTHKLFYKVVV